MRLTGAQIVLRTLEKLGLNAVFAYPQKSLDWFLTEKERPKNLQFVYALKPENTIYMAAGFTRSSGKPSVVIVPPGAGATQIITGLQSAHLDSLPIICITGQVPSSVLGTDAFQEADTIGMTQSCTKHNYLVNDVSQIQRILTEAHYLATSGRPGPVLMDLPIDLLEQLAEFSTEEMAPARLKGYKPVEKGHVGQVKKAVDMILACEKPVIYCGGGAVLSHADSEVLALAELLSIPVAQTLTGIGSIPGDHPLNLGLVGHRGHEASNMTANSADVLISIGTRFNPHVLNQVSGFWISSKVIHIDIDPSSIAKHTRVDVPIVGDARDVLTQMIAMLKELKGEVKKFREKLKPWHEQIDAWKSEAARKQPDKTFDIQSVIQTLAKATHNDAIVAASRENWQVLVAKHYPFNSPRAWCCTGGMEVYGYTLSAAIGAQIANPGKTVVAITSTENLLMNLAELTTLLREKLPIKILLINEVEKKDSVRTQPVNLAELMNAYGLAYNECNSVRVFETQIKKALSSKKPHFLTCDILL